MSKPTTKMLLPKLRFPEFRDVGEWEEYQLYEIASFSKGKGISKSDVVVDGKLPCIRYGELYTLYGETIKEVSSHTNVPAEELVLSKANDVIIPASGETQEDIATASCVKESGVALGGDLNIIRSEHDGVFLSYYLNSAKKKDITQMAQGISVIHLYANQLKQLDVNLPKISEQQKIADCLSSIDELITAHTQKHEALKAHKNGLMQQLFPTEGETVPKLRFPEFQDAGEWGRKCLGACLDYIQPTNYLVKSTAYNDSYKTPVLTAGKTFILGYTDESEGVFSNKLPVIIFDDFTTASKFVDFPFKAKSSAMKILFAKEDTDIKFIYEAIQRIKYEVGVHKRHWISVFSKRYFAIPKPSEQQKIADCFSSVDEQITAQAQKIDTLKAHKKGLMQQLFPSVDEVNG